MNEVSSSISAARSIASDGYSQSTVVKALESRVHELLTVQEENIQLKHQLKLAEERSQLMEAEFSFQKSLLEDEIKSLKQIEESEVRNTKNEASKYNVSAHVTIDPEMIPNQDNNVSKATFSNNTSLKSQYRAMSTPMQMSASTSHEVNTERPTAKLNRSVDDLLTSQSVPSATPFSLLEKEKLTLKLERANSQIKRLRVYEQQNQEYNKALSHYQTQLEALCDAFGTDIPDKNEEWTVLRAKAQELHKVSHNLTLSDRRLEEALGKISKLEDTNKQLNSDLSRINAEKRIALDKSNMSSQYAESLNEVAKLKHTLSRYEKMSQIWQSRSVLSRIIADGANKTNQIIQNMAKQLDLTNRSDFRTLILAVVFLRRLNNHSPSQFYHPSSLIALSSAKIPSNEQVLTHFIQTMADLSQSLLKKSEESVKTPLTIPLNPDTESLEQELSIYKARNEELQQELAQFVSNDTYQAALSDITSREIEIEQLQKIIQESSQLNMEYHQEIEALRAKVRSLKTKHKLYLQSIQSHKEESLQSDSTISTLRTKLKEQQHSVYYLERRLSGSTKL